MSFLNRIKFKYVTSASVLPMLQEALKTEYQQWDMYYTYKDRLRGACRDSVADHFEEHAKDEADHIETLQRHIQAMGAEPTLDRLSIPKLEKVELRPILLLQIKFEEQAVAHYKMLLDTLGEENSALRIDIENIMTQEQEHAHDLHFML